MKIVNIRNIGGGLLGLMLLFGAVVMSGTTAQAQYWPNQDQIRRQRDYERAQRERERQLEMERQAQIERERQRNDRWDNRNDRWDNRNDRWDNRNDRWDNRNDRGRRGRNWDGYGNSGGSYELRQTALNAGYNEGLKAGRDDRRHNDRFDFCDEGAYQRANKDFNSRFGDRYAYQQYFRAAFENGYSDGYRYAY